MAALVLFREKFDAAWQDMNKGFWEKFKAGLRERGAGTKNN